MAKMPGAKQRPLAARMTQPRMLSHRVVCIHTMVGSLNGTESMFKQGGYAGTESHFGTGGDGEIRQWVDTDYSADANYRGSRDVISIENADHGPEFPRWNTSGDNVPPFTAAQIEANAQIIAWVHQTHGTPIVLIPNTRPQHNGVGYHAQGVPGNGLVSGGVSWSKARGKVCPGRRRIAQIPQIIRRAQEIVGGAPIATIEEDTMRRLGAATRTKDFTINAGQTNRVPAYENGTIRLCNLKKGQAITGDIWFDITGLLQGEKALVRPVIAYWNPKKKVTTIKHRYPSVEVVGIANGQLTRGHYGVTDGSVGYGGGGDEQSTLQFEIVAPPGRAIKSTYMRHDILGS